MMMTVPHYHDIKPADLSAVLSNAYEAGKAFYVENPDCSYEEYVDAVDKYRKGLCLVYCKREDCRRIRGSINAEFIFGVLDERRNANRIVKRNCPNSEG